MCATCLLLYALVLPRLPVMRAAHCRLSPLAQAEDAAYVEDSAPQQPGSLDVELSASGGYAPTKQVCRLSHRAILTKSSSMIHAVAMQEEHTEEEYSEAQQELIGGFSQIKAAPLVWRVARKLWHIICALVLTYVITLAIFPGFLVEDISSQALGDWCAAYFTAGY